MAGNKRERELARAKYERQQQRRSQRAASARRRTQIATSVVVAVLVVVGFTYLAKQQGSSSSDAAPGSSAGASDLTPSAGTGRVGCLYKKADPQTHYVGLPPASAPVVPGTSTATLTLNSGVVQIKLLDSKAPCTVNSFGFLAQAKYFNGTTCHRLTKSPTLSVLQCGDPSASGSGGPGYQFADENLTGATYPAGTVAMANAGPDTNGSQFFLVYANSQLAPSYTPFGTITSGLNVLQAIGNNGIKGGGTDGAPATPVTITTVAVSGS